MPGETWDWWRLGIAFYFSTCCDLHKLSLFIYPSSQLSSIIMINESETGLFLRLLDMVVCYIFLNRLSNALLFLTDGDFSTPKFPNSPSFPLAVFSIKSFTLLKHSLDFRSFSPLQRLQIYLQKYIEMFPCFSWFNIIIVYKLSVRS